MESVQVEFDFETAFNLSLEVAEKCDFNIEQTSMSDGEIRASTEATLLSWGEEVTIELSEESDRNVEIKIESEPSSQIIDWGKSRGNERMFITELQEVDE